MFLWNQICRQSSFGSIILPKDILSASNQENCLNLLKKQRPVASYLKKNQKKAAVLVPICEFGEHIGLLYTVRALQLKVNGGQVAFPGGMFDDSDGNLQSTALRETHEEIGIPTESIKIWGNGPEIYREQVVVTPFIGYAGRVDINKLSINADEVSEVFAVPLKQLSSPDSVRYTQFRAGSSDVFKTPAYLGGKKRIWGLTGVITHIMLSALIPEHYSVKFKSVAHKVLRSEKT